MSQTNTRTIRIFISSTFRDMQAERDELTQRIFPELRARCRERNLNLVEVDLRWGITEEQEKQGKVLSLCLDQIDQSRPYFIGLLGDRYGTIPESVDEKLLKQYPWLRNHLDKSLTELEMLHGVLYNISEASHAYFYFRSPSYYNNVSKEETDLFIEDDPEKSRSQKALKDRIVSEGLQVYDGYANPKELGDQVLSDIWSSIDKQFPESAVKGSQTLYSEDSDAFENIASDIYVDRKEEEKLYEVLQASDLMAIEGDPGSGKTELLKNWLRKLSKRHPEYFILDHYSQDVDRGHSLDHLLDHFISQLDSKLDNSSDPAVTFDAKIKTLVFLLQEQSKKSKILIGIDALDELYQDENAADFGAFWNQLPEGVKVVCTLNDRTVLDRIRNREWVILPMEPLTYFQREIIITQYLLRYGKQLSPERKKKLSRNALCANPLFLRTVLEELRVDAKHEELDSKIDSFIAARSLTDLFKIVVENYQLRINRMYPGILDKALSFITLSQNGLTENELLHLLGQEKKPFTYHDWSVVFLTLQETLRIASGRIVFKHSFFQEIIYEKYFQDQKSELKYRNEIIAFFKEQEFNTRNTLELAYQFHITQQWEELYVLLTRTEIFSNVLKGDTKFTFIKYFLALEKRYDLLQCFKEVYSKYQKNDHPEAEELEFLNKLGKFAYYLYKPQIAIYFLKESLRLTKKVYGWDHELTILKMKSLGEAMIDGDNLNETKVFFRQVLALCHKKYGMENPLTSKVFSGLVECYARLKQPLAEDLYPKALELCKKVHGVNHLETSILIDNMATYLDSSEGRTDRIKLHEEALEICINSVGVDHIDTAKCHDNLARVFIENENWEDGLKHAYIALDIFSRRLGEEHRDTQIALFNIYIAYRNSGDDINAVQTLIRCANSNYIIENYSLDWIIKELRNLSSYLAYSGHYDEAEEANLKLNELAQQENGSSNISTMLGLANISYEKGVYQEAIKQYRQILTAPLPGEEDKDSILCQCYIGLAKCVEGLGQIEEAHDYLMKALDLIDRVKKGRDLMRTECYNRLAIIKLHLGEIDLAGEYCDKALKHSEELHGEDTFLTSNILNLKGQVEVSRGNFEEARKYMQKSYDLALEAYGEKHTSTITYLNNLAYVVKELGDYEKAEETILRVIELRAELLGEDHQATGNSINMLAGLYFEKGEYEKAEKQYEKVIDILPKDHKDFRYSWSEKSLLLVECKLEQKKYSELIDICNRVIELNKEYPDEKSRMAVITALGRNYQSYNVLGESELAEEMAQFAVNVLSEEDSDPTRETGHWYIELATSIVNQGRISEATAHYEKGLAILLNTAGQEHSLTRQAVKLLEQNVEFCKNEPFYKTYILLSRAENYIMNGKIDSAKAIVESVLHLCEDEFDRRDVILGKAHSILGSLYLKQERFTESVEVYRIALEYGKKTAGEDHPEIIDHLSNLAFALRNAGEFGEAILIYEELVSTRHVNNHLRPEDLMHFFKDFIFCLLKFGKEERAIEIVIMTFDYFEANLKDVDYESHSVYLMLSKLFRQHSSPRVEKTMLEKIIEKVPADSRFWELWGRLVYYELADVHQKLGNRDDALSCYKKVIAPEYNLGGGPELFVEKLQNTGEDYDISEDFGQEWINSLYYLIFLRDIPNEDWDTASKNYETAQKLLYFNQNKKYSLVMEFEYYARLVEEGRSIDVGKAHESVEMYLLSGNINSRINTGISALGLSYRSQNMLEEAEYFSMKALELDSKILDKNDPALSVKLRNVAIIMLLRKKYEQAIKYSTLGWQVLGGRFDFVAARLLVIRIIIGMISGKKITDYLGQLKALLETAVKSVDPEFHPEWKIGIMIDFLVENSTKEIAGFVTDIVDVINLKKEISVLSDWEIWKEQDLVSLEIPWPAEGY